MLDFFLVFLSLALNFLRRSLNPEKKNVERTRSHVSVLLSCHSSLRSPSSLDSNVPLVTPRLLWPLSWHHVHSISLSNPRREISPSMRKSGTMTGMRVDLVIPSRDSFLSISCVVFSFSLLLVFPLLLLFPSSSCLCLANTIPCLFACFYSWRWEDRMREWDIRSKSTKALLTSINRWINLSCVILFSAFSRWRRQSSSLAMLLCSIYSNSYLTVMFVIRSVPSFFVTVLRQDMRETRGSFDLLLCCLQISSSSFSLFYSLSESVELVHHHPLMIPQ